MNCTSCNYPLWNLPARTCPECGETFRPSDFTFVPSAVKFCCPHCRQAYYGTDDNGHLVPRAFDCVSCGRRIEMDEMIVLPTEGVTEPATQQDRMPWLERPQRGLLSAWFGTIGAAMVRPASLMRAIPNDADTGAAWAFMFVSNLLFLVVASLIPALFMLVVFGVLGAVAGMPPGLRALMTWQALSQVVLAIASLAICPVAWAALSHALLKITGRTTAPLRRTAQAIYYSAGANAISAFPFCTCMRDVGLVWWLVSATLMVHEAHRCHGFRAAFAVVSSGLAMGVLLVAASMLAALGPVAWSIPGAFGGLGAATETQMMAGAVGAYAAAHEGKGPAHAAELLVTGNAQPVNFVGAATATVESQVPVATATLDRLSAMTPDEQGTAAAAATAALPPGTVAHRLGDFVFTYHGLDLAEPDPRLWIVIYLPDPTVNGPPAATDTVWIGRAGARLTSATYGGLPALLRSQNALRAELGLPPLPDPASVTHGSPAAAPGQVPGPPPPDGGEDPP